MDKVDKKDEKCFSVIGFAKSESVSLIPRYLYVGKNVVLFVANTATKSHSEESESEAFRHPACTAVSALAQALVELESVALVRRVYSRASAPALGLLAPR
ncbi:unnamed protein product [Mesocestoides corti]|uniref:Ku domain-containing protein n=1 Tax=Mesocestoides corti TaxID=53468 RepID=A0A3P6HNY0_MESCO|nr:unnamed protein product [Mesocestoides corti]